MESEPNCTCHLGPGLNLNCAAHGEIVQQMQVHAAQKQGLCGHLTLLPYSYRVCKLPVGHEVRPGDH